MSLKRECDRCRKQKKHTDAADILNGYVSLEVQQLPNMTGRFDLCRDCALALSSWLQSPVRVVAAS